MNVLILTASAAEALIAHQEGRHRLGPVALTDGRYFLMADVLDEPLYQGKLDEADYETAPFENIAGLMPWQEEWTTELARIDVATATRLATAGYTAPANSDIAAIKAKTDTLVNKDLTGIATSAEIEEVKKNTDLIPGAL